MTDICRIIIKINKFKLLNIFIRVINFNSIISGTIAEARWIHKDSGRAIGGIIYLDKDPEEETGTSLYKNKQLIFPHSHEEDSCKRRWYTGKDVSDEEYHNLFYSNPTHFEETVKVKNVYNRLFMFNGNEYHGVQTYGSHDRTRLTLAFFITYVNHNTYPFPTIRE